MTQHFEMRDVVVTDTLIGVEEMHNPGSWTFHLLDRRSSAFVVDEHVIRNAPEIDVLASAERRLQRHAFLSQPHEYAVFIGDSLAYRATATEHKEALREMHAWLLDNARHMHSRHEHKLRCRPTGPWEKF